MEEGKWDGIKTTVGLPTGVVRLNKDGSVRKLKSRKTCYVCGLDAHAKGLCARHYKRAERHEGDPSVVDRPGRKPKLTS